MRPSAATVAAVVALTVGCGVDAPSLSAWCGLVADGAVVPLNAPDAPARWLQLEESAPADVRADAERLRVAAHQVARLDHDDLASAARLVLTPMVLAAHGRVIDVIGSRCRIDVSTLTVIDSP